MDKLPTVKIINKNRNVMYPKGSQCYTKIEKKKYKNGKPQKIKFWKNWKEGGSKDVQMF